MTPSPTWLADEAMSPQQIYFGFQGRIPRRIWWLYGVFGLLGVGVLGYTLLRVAGMSEEKAESVVNLLLTWPALAVSVKRWHDRDKSGLWVLVNFVPVIGPLWTLIENGLLPGSPRSNRYGEDLSDQL
ncbi:DUF805 domain-containing protein [Azohydromonas caseinilytica]|uniref:DUF805 domain-containing protein n=1 Tax=Azohydromonas caseinilytica TaxID=2728836 RepID=A0A848F3V5_9BURK|nr:DUF805 domain-containing protein [Azohydromonas caseinilytica]NML14767.1 DUF805 domain-containing protein [Azohydromonas caseinilytica]